MKRAFRVFSKILTGFKTEILDSVKSIETICYQRLSRITEIIFENWGFSKQM